MTAGMWTIMYPVADLDAAKSLYGELFGVEPYMDESYYVGYKVADQNIGLDPTGTAKVCPDRPAIGMLMTSKRLLTVS